MADDYGKDLTFKGHSHGSTLSITPKEREADLGADLLSYPRHPTNHYENFLKACKGLEPCLSPFELAAPLSQVFCLGLMAQKFNTPLKFDRQTKQIINHDLANRWLKGTPPRKGWEEFYRMAKLARNHPSQQSHRSRIVAKGYGNAMGGVVTGSKDLIGKPTVGMMWHGGLYRSARGHSKFAKRRSVYASHCRNFGTSSCKIDM